MDINNLGNIFEQLLKTMGKQKENIEDLQLQIYEKEENIINMEDQLALLKNLESELKNNLKATEDSYVALLEEVKNKKLIGTMTINEKIMKNIEQKNKKPKDNTEYKRLIKERDNLVSIREAHLERIEELSIKKAKNIISEEEDRERDNLFVNVTFQRAEINKLNAQIEQLKNN